MVARSTLAAVIVLSACANAGITSAPDPVDGGQEVTEVVVQVGGTARVAERQVTFVGVTTDSRCPTGVTCVWEGDASVELQVSAEGAAPETLLLHTHDAAEREGRASGLRIRLVRLDPYPAADQPIPPGDYRATLAIEP